MATPNSDPATQPPPEKGNFGIVVASAGAFLVLAIITIYLLLHHHEKDMKTRTPDPQPNSMYAPAYPGPVVTLPC